MNSIIFFLLSFGAGLLSFISPCVLPLIPSWLLFLGGTVSGGTASKAETAPIGTAPGAPETSPGAAGAKTGPRLMAVTACFILGFSAVFVVMSVIMAGTMLLLGGIGRIINLISGIIVIILGLNVIFDFLKFLNYEKRLHFSGPPRGFIGAFFAGIAFGAGWTPCVGPILGSILLLAGQDGRLAWAVICLCAYSAGLGLPFLAAAFLFNRSLEKSGRNRKSFMRSRAGLIRVISGIFLVVIGFLIIFGRYQALNAFLARSQYRIQDWLRGIFQGHSG
ncbi:MAG: cytochrome c biogenesis protein CcdA [Treponema sp.]|jgi:cytochrome c-type biogenesis protein|nr:cytochrome c biogenesis protein CcdA [Treponema sp.]